jgi:hypothetical protein
MLLEFGMLLENLADHAASSAEMRETFPIPHCLYFSAIDSLFAYCKNIQRRREPQLIISHGRFQTLRLTLHPRRRWEHADLRQKQHVLINRTELLD